ncbi:FAD binding domain-containing protein [Albidovulum sp.]|uniref:FAD binding domain-containing protein n=1 Tax=Albidovulum sp. TaxID=1872424 RepID=UPI0039B88CE9
MYADFDLLVPEKLDQALAMIAGARSARDAAPLGGGTNLVVEMRAKGEGPATLVSIGRLAGLRGITIGDHRVTIGAATTVSDILRHPGMADAAPALVESARVFAGQMVRNTATVAGNICCGSPAADLVPPLMALGATVTLQTGKSSRDVALDAYFTGYKASVRQPDELITAISWPRPDAASTSRFYKLARRKGDAITVVGVSVLVAMKSGVCTEVRVALGAVGPCVFRARTAEALLRGQAPTAERVARAAALAAAEATPIDDIRATGAYRKEQVEVLVGRLLNQTIESLS